MMPVDISARTNDAAVTLLVTFAETITTTAGRVTPSASGFTLDAPGRKAKRFDTATPAVRALRKLTRKATT